MEKVEKIYDLLNSHWKLSELEEDETNHTVFFHFKITIDSRTSIWISIDATENIWVKKTELDTKITSIKIKCLLMGNLKYLNIEDLPIIINNHKTVGYYIDGIS